MRCHDRFLCVAVLGILCACGGDGSPTTTALPQTNPAVTGPASNSRSVELGPQPTSAELPVVKQIRGTMVFPAVAAPVTIALTGSATDPAGVALQSVKPVVSGTLTVYEYQTIASPTTVRLLSLPALTLHFPTATPLTGKSFSYGVSDLDAQGGLVSFDTHGPGTINGRDVSFPLVPTSLTLVAGHKYTFVVYGVAAAPVKLYVANGIGSVTTYTLDGVRTTPTITGLYGFSGIAVDAAGKIYVTNGPPDRGPWASLTTYTTDGVQTTPTIGFIRPGGVAVDLAGKIYVAEANVPFSSGGVTTHNADGSRTPTIYTGISDPAGVAVDAAGKLYVADQGSNAVETFTPDGSPTTPTITAGLDSPVAVTVDAAGKIYVANIAYDNHKYSVTTYNADGTRALPTITSGLDGPYGVAVNAAGKIYVANRSNSTVTTYNADGTRANPTITTGLHGPVGVAVH